MAREGADQDVFVYWCSPNAERYTWGKNFWQWLSCRIWSRLELKSIGASPTTAKTNNVNYWNYRMLFRTAFGIQRRKSISSATSRLQHISRKIYGGDVRNQTNKTETEKWQRSSKETMTNSQTPQNNMSTMAASTPTAILMVLTQVPSAHVHTLTKDLRKRRHDKRKEIRC